MVKKQTLFNIWGRTIIRRERFVKDETYTTAVKEIKHIVDWIKHYFIKNGADSKAIIGISGGKDSTIAAALCVNALGTDRVIGILMSQGVQTDIKDARRVCEFLGIHSYEIGIGSTCGPLNRGKYAF